jgi:DNA-binding transcriptional regulator YiaG
MFESRGPAFWRSVRASAHGDVIDIDVGILELMAAKAVLKAGVPLRGREVRVLRKILGFSLERFAAEIKLTSGSIFKWEHKPEDRLHPINEIAVRAYLAEKFGVKISGKYSVLLGLPGPAKTLVLKAG